MAYFTFNKKLLDSLPAAAREEVNLAVSTAEKLAGYYQEFAKALFIGIQPPERPYLSPREASLAAEFELGENRFRSPTNTSSPAAIAAFKLFSAAQADFYCSHPNYIVVFGSGCRALPLMMTFLQSSAPKSWAAVDTYLSQSADRLAKFVTNLSPGPDDQDYGPTFSP